MKITTLHRYNYRMDSNVYLCAFRNSCFKPPETVVTEELELVIDVP